MMKSIKMLTMALPMVLLSSLSGKASNQDINDILIRPPLVKYPTFHTSGYTFDDNSETGFYPTLKAFAEEQEKDGKADKPVCIVINSDVHRSFLTSGKDKNPFRHLIIKLDSSMDHPDDFILRVNLGLMHSENIRSIQYLGFDKLEEICFHFSLVEKNLEIIDISSLVSLNLIFWSCRPCNTLKTIYVAGEAQKKLVEDNFQGKHNPPKIIIKTDDTHFSELKADES